MNLAELRYIVALDRERHFGRAAERCFISQPSLSTGIKNLEKELDVILFERGNEIMPTDIGREIVEEARQILQRVSRIQQLAKTAVDPLQGALRVGLIYTVAPYLLPTLVKEMTVQAPQMPLHIQENFTHHLVERISKGDIDAAVIAAPFPTHLESRVVYTETFVVAVPLQHPWSTRQTIDKAELANEIVLLLGEGHCFRNNVLEICAERQHGNMLLNSTDVFDGGSLETIRHTVASGYGITVLPATAKKEGYALAYIPFCKPEPQREIGLIWRKNYPRTAAIEALYTAIQRCPLAVQFAA